MFDIFKNFADWVIVSTNVDINTNFGSSLHFFIEDITKIFVLTYFLMFFISLFRSQLSPEKVREYLSGKSRWYGYILAVILGVITPFCSCSSIPMFIGFIVAGVPFGTSMAFLVSSPLVSEIAALMLFTLKGAGPFISFVYIVSGSIIAIFAGYLCDILKLEKYIKFESKKISKISEGACSCENCASKSKIKKLIIYANKFSLETLLEIWVFVVIGLVIGAFMHGYIPQEFFVKYLGANNLFAVPLASIAGTPLYASHGGVIPIVQVLLMKNVPIGTALVFLMSVTSISIPEIMMLSKILKWKMLAIFVIFLIVSFIFTGYFLNTIMYFY